MYSVKSLKIAYLTNVLPKIEIIVINESHWILVNPTVIFLWVYNSNLKKKRHKPSSFKANNKLNFLKNIADVRVLCLQKAENIRPPGAIGADNCLWVFQNKKSASHIRSYCIKQLLCSAQYINLISVWCICLIVL